MYSHKHLHRLALGLALVVGLLLSACAGPSPGIKVLGAEQAHRGHSTGKLLVVFVEVTNPTDRPIQLSRLEYHFRADALYDSKGEVALARSVGAGSSTVVEIPVPLSPTGAAASVPYTLDGRLFARENRIERFWNVAVKGALDGRATAAAPSLTLTVANAE